ncbi:MAG: M48 family metalloprotease [Candidatus Omnitrophota bacterium]|nr:M48 family metalloprotease [Candidatus Omnitrophota bacterium]
MVKKIRFFPYLCALSLCLGGCATLHNPATGRNEFILINSATESALGKTADAQMRKEHPASSDRIVHARLENIGKRVAAVSDRMDISYSFTVLADRELNAVTLPGGRIYVNQGLMNALGDDELAYVVAHETGHVAARHIAKKIQANMGYQLLLSLAFAAYGEKVGDNAQDIARGATTVYTIVGLAYSRSDEYEADRLAVKYARAAGFDHYASMGALAKLKKYEGPNSKIAGYFRTHPYVDDRIAALKKELSGVQQK